jgi:hypothetical protein
VNNCDVCYKHSCANNSTCVPASSAASKQTVDDAYRCVCSVGFYGEKCERKVDACYTQPCKNQGACRALSSTSYKCECKGGWEGQSCEINTNECRSMPCMNNGTCVDKLAAYDCVCPRGFTGLRHSS